MKRKEAKAHSGAVEIMERMKGGIGRYESGKELLIGEKEEISKELAKAEAELTGLSETQEFSEEVKVALRYHQ